MKNVKDTATQMLVWALLGASVMTGMKVIDWAIPNPPKEPIRLELTEKTKPAALSDSSI